MTLSHKITLQVLFIAALLSAIALSFFFRQPTIVHGSVVQGSEYQGTTTPVGGFLTIGMVATTSEGAFGSVVITNVGTASFTLYDATTSDATQRTNKATTTLAVFPASATVGTYTFDEIVRYGILAVFGAGTQATTTITYR